MPTYQYKCKECGIVFDRFQHFSDDPLTDCPECSGPVYRVIQPVGIIFKGKGFYVNDNKGSTAALMPKSEDKSAVEEKVATATEAATTAAATEPKPTEPAPKAQDTSASSD